MNLKDMTGERLGKVLVLSPTMDLSTPNISLMLEWNCWCDCGEYRKFPHKLVVGRKIKSCGCIRKKHGMSGTRFHEIWMAMKARCNGTAGERSKYYNGKGITYCKELESFNNFLTDMKEGYNDNLELERLDVSGNYCKENCTWVTHGEQVINRGQQVNNTSGRTGVRMPKNNPKWVASIQIDGKAIHLGSFSLFEDAVKAREDAELKYFGFVKDE